jgi:hypothetical protein
VLGKHPGGANTIPQAELVPWISVKIIIIGTHAKRGYSDVVTNIFCNQSTTSGLQIVVQIMSPLVATGSYTVWAMCGLQSVGSK